MKSILLVKKLLGLAEMTFGLVTASFSLPEGQAVKMIFFAPCICLLASAFVLCFTRLCSASESPNRVIIFT